MSELISRQAAIDEVLNMKVGHRVSWKDAVVDALDTLPSAEPTLYGYDIKQLELIARTLQKENLPPERVADVLSDIGRIVEIVCDEFTESLSKTELLKTTDYCVICKQDMCRDCIADATNPYCVPSHYEIKQTNNTGHKTEPQSEKEQTMRLIDADALIEVQIYDEEHEEWSVETMTVEECLARFADVPTIIETDRPQGEWIEHEHGFWTFVNDRGERDGWLPDYECNLCGSRAWSYATNYCPNCGARMKGVEGE